MELSLAELIALIGGWSLVVGGLSAWIGKLLAERMLLRWRRTEEAELERLKARLAEDRLVIDTAIKNFSLGQQQAQEKKLVAIEALWGKLLALRAALQSAIGVYALLQPSEYNDLRTNARLQHIADDLTLDYVANAVATGRELEKHRPYLGETLWYLFAVYSAVLGRMAAFIARGKEEGKIEDWRQDDLIQQYLKGLVPPDELDRLLDPHPKAADRLLEVLEGQILREISLIVSGERSAAESFEQALKLKGGSSEPSRLGVEPGLPRKRPS